MEYAVIETGGKQYRVQPGSHIQIELLPGAVPGDTVSFEKVLMLKKDGHIAVGRPYLDQTQVTGEVVRSYRADKIKIIKFRRRKHYDKQAGHRQYLLDVKISLNEPVLGE